MAVAAVEAVATVVEAEVLLQSTPIHSNKDSNSSNSSQMEHPWTNEERRMELDLDEEQSVATDVVDYLGCWSPSLLLLCGWHNPSFNNLNTSLDACCDARVQGELKLYPSGELPRMPEDQQQYRTRRQSDMSRGMNLTHTLTHAVQVPTGG